MREEVKSLKRMELENTIKSIEEKIEGYQQELQKLREQLDALKVQEKERENFVSSKEIIDLIASKVGKKVNMSTIKRWADEGYLGEVIDEKEKFWAVHSKQGKKRFLYPKAQAFTFLYEKGFLQPEFEVLDRVLVKLPEREPVIAIVINSSLRQGEFLYTLQVEGTFDILKDVKERELTLASGDVKEA
jgi:RNase P/RNase MRP subunit p29